MAFNKIKPVPVACQRNVVIYARYSSDKQTENSIDGQLRECRKYCDQHEYQIIGEYIDRAASGTTDNRPEFQRMIHDSAKQQFAYVIVYRFDRFARNRYDSAIYKKQLMLNGVKVISVSENVGVGDEGIILESIYEAMDEAYSRRLSAITKRGMREAARKGLWTGGVVPLGYRVENRQFVIDEREAGAVRLIFNRYEEGKTKKQIADELNAAGYRTKTGKPFTHANFTAVLRNKVYYGDYSFEDVERTCPAIITKEQFERVQKLQVENQRCFGRKVSETFFALGGKLFCGNCGAAMIGDSGTSRSGEKHYYYTCGKRKKAHSCNKKSERKDFIEWYICEQTLDLILSPKNIKTIAKNVAALAAAELNDGQLDALRKQKKQIDKELDEAVSALMKTNAETAIAKINERLERLDEQKKTVEIELAGLELRQEIVLTEEQVESYLTSFKHSDILDENVQRRVINTLINAVYLYDDKVVIYYNIKGLKQISYIDMISDTEKLSEPENSGSDSLKSGSPCWARTNDPTRKLEINLCILSHFSHLDLTVCLKIPDKSILDNDFLSLLILRVIAIPDKDSANQRIHQVSVQLRDVIVLLDDLYELGCGVIRGSFFARQPFELHQPILCGFLLRLAFLRHHSEASLGQQPRKSVLIQASEHLIAFGNLAFQLGYFFFRALFIRSGCRRHLFRHCVDKAFPILSDTPENIPQIIQHRRIDLIVFDVVACADILPFFLICVTHIISAVCNGA